MNITVFLLLPLILFFWLIGKKTRFSFSGRQSKNLLLLYSAVLTLSFITVYALPLPGYGNADEPNQAIIQAEETLYKLPQIAKEGKLDSTPGVYKLSSMDFNLQGNELTLSPDPYGSYHEVFLEKKEAADGLITVSSYTTTTIIQGIDITPQIRPPIIRLSGNRLELSSPENYTLAYTSFKPDFTAEQFSGPIPENWHITDPKTTLGREIIYLQIPSNMTVVPNQTTIFQLEDSQIIN